MRWRGWHQKLVTSESISRQYSQNCIIVWLVSACRIGLKGSRASYVTYNTNLTWRLADFMAKTRLKTHPKWRPVVFLLPNYLIRQLWSDLFILTLLLVRFSSLFLVCFSRFEQRQVFSLQDINEAKIDSEETMLYVNMYFITLSCHYLAMLAYIGLNMSVKK